MLNARRELTYTLIIDRDKLLHLLFIFTPEEERVGVREREMAVGEKWMNVERENC